MKRVSIPLSLLLFLFINLPLAGQSFDEGLSLYEQGAFEEAKEVFRSIDEDDRAVLFLGKSHLALGQETEANRQLRMATESDNRRVVDEANYSLALLAYQLNDFGRALEMLRSLSSSGDSGLRRQAESLYRSILSYLTPRQRLDTYWRTENKDLRFDLLDSAARGPDPELARAMLQQLRESAGDPESPRIRDLESQIEQALNRGVTPLQYRPPAGTVYRIGVLLPSFEPDDPTLEVSRGLYSGLLMAAEEYNSRNTDRKVLLRYRNSAADPDSVSRAMHELMWAERSDVIVGPLFSEEATELSRLAEQYQIPALTPLANSDHINEGHQYTFQLNPTFAVHGRRMARHAVEDLQLDTLAIFSQSSSSGEISANAFRREAEQLGAHIAYDFRENFADYGYDLSEFTEIFTTDQALIDSLGYSQVDGVYAPFTGQDAETLISQLMTDIELMGSQPVILGSETWGVVNLTEAQQRRFEIWHTAGYRPSPPEESEQFTEEFQDRFGFEADEFARIGYDSGQFLLQALEQAGNPARLSRMIRNAPRFSGLALDIHFDGTQINRQIRLEPLSTPARNRLER